MGAMTHDLPQFCVPPLAKWLFKVLLGWGVRNDYSTFVRKSYPEILKFQMMTTSGGSVTLPAPRVVILARQSAHKT